MIISLIEIIDIVIMTVVVGYIFMGFLSRPSPEYYLKKQRFDWESFKIACWITAPALILHELAHKFVAVGFGFSATFHAAYAFLALGVVLRLIQSNFIFFVPAYVTIGCISITKCVIPPIQSALIAGAGPFTNLGLFIGAHLALKYKKKMKKKTRVILHLTKIINLFLFIFNMLPFYIFDGYKFFSGLYNHFF
jgi:Zn-dependent protease